MIKHAHESSPTTIIGQLLANVDGDMVEITFAYPMPSSEGDFQQVNSADFQQDIINRLRQVKVFWYIDF